jgi:hypothetical protein
LLAQVNQLKRKAPDVNIGYSMIICSEGTKFNGVEVPDNIDQIPRAAIKAKKYGFNYLSLKACLIKQPDYPVEKMSIEVACPIKNSQYMSDTISRIQEKVKEAKEITENKIDIILSKNLTGLLNQELDLLRNQPKTCHIGFFRQVISPLGVYHCPAYRGSQSAYVGASDSYSKKERIPSLQKATAKNLLEFDASHNCKDIACFYNDVNNYIENLITSGADLNNLKISPDEELFL